MRHNMFEDYSVAMCKCLECILECKYAQEACGERYMPIKAIISQTQ